jgi:hypothetical protein
VAERIEQFKTDVAAGASGAFVAHSFLDGTVTRVELYVPAGHAGLTQWSFWYGTSQLVPKTAGAAVIADDERFAWDIEEAPTGSGYQSRVTNNDDIVHSFYVQVWIEEFREEGPLPDFPVLILPIGGVA